MLVRVIVGPPRRRPAAPAWESEAGLRDQEARVEASDRRASPASPAPLGIGSEDDEQQVGRAFARRCARPVERDHGATGRLIPSLSRTSRTLAPADSAIADEKDF